MRDYVTPLSFGGFKFDCRVITQDRPRLAPFLVIGGAFSDKSSWEWYGAQFSPLATVVLADLPGYGTADTLPARYGVEFLADAAHHLAVELDLPPLNVLGGSYGGAVAYLLARRHPAAVHRLALCGVGVQFPEPTRRHARRCLDLLRARQMAGFARGTAQMFLSPAGTGPVRRQPAVQRLLEHRLRTLRPDETDKYLQNVRRLLDGPLPALVPPPGAPTLITTGEHDTFTTPAMCRAIAALCPDAHFTTIREADHLVHLERRAEFVDLVVRFFAGERLDRLPYLTGIERFGVPAP